jgi:hypothetical protein
MGSYEFSSGSASRDVFISLTVSRVDDDCFVVLLPVAAVGSQGGAW